MEDNKSNTPATPVANTTPTADNTPVTPTLDAATLLDEAMRDYNPEPSRDEIGLTKAEAFKEEKGIVDDTERVCAACGHFHGEVLSKRETNDRLSDMWKLATRERKASISIQQKSAFREVVVVPFNMEVGEFTVDDLNANGLCPHCRVMLIEAAKAEKKFIKIFNYADTRDRINDYQQRAAARAAKENKYSNLVGTHGRDRDGRQVLPSSKPAKGKGVATFGELADKKGTGTDNRRK